MRSVRQLWVILFVAGCLTGPVAAWARAAEKYAPGEEVEVLHSGAWRPAKVRDSNPKGEVLAEYAVGANKKTEIFPADKVRHLYEAGALTRGRSWSDADGKFKVKAALLKVADGKVELRADDMTIVSIRIDKLSPKDQTFVKQVQRQAGPAALPVPVLPALTTFDAASADNDPELPSDKGNIGLPQLTVDPLPKGIQLVQAGTGFPAENPNEKIESLLAVGGADNWLLASTGALPGQPSRLLWLALAKDGVQKAQLLPAGEMLIDYHAGSRQILTYSQREIAGSSGRQPVLTVWKTDPATDEPKAVVSWNACPPGEQSAAATPGALEPVPWARFASAMHVVQLTESHYLLGWDFESRRLAWSVRHTAVGSSQPRLSGGGAYLYLPEDSGLRIMDSANGRTLGQVKLHGCSGVAVHADGRRIAAGNQQEIQVVDITGEQPLRKLSLAAFAKLQGTEFDWIGEKYLVFKLGRSSFTLYSFDLELPVWSYELDHEISRAYTSKVVRPLSIVDDHLVYAASITRPGKNGLAVGAVKLPGEKALAAIAAVKREDLLAIRPGAHFRIEVTAIDHADEIRQAIEKEAIANGWILDPAAPNTLQAEYKRGKTQQVQYQMRTVAGAARDIRAASVTPYVCTLSLRIGQVIAWQDTTANAVPSIVYLEEGESLQSELERWNRPAWPYFQKLDIPAEIVDPAKRGGIGKTAVTTRGLLEQVLKQTSEEGGAVPQKTGSAPIP